MERKTLTSTQKELLRMKREKINEAIMLARQRDADFNLALNQIAAEHGIEEAEYPKWKLSKNDAFLDFAPSEEEPKPKIPGKKPRR